MALDPEQLAEACGADPGWVCEQVLRLTDNTQAASLAGWLVDRPLKIVIVVLLALLVIRVARRGIDRFATRIRAEPGLRSAQRADTLRTVLRSTATTIVWCVALLVVLGEIGINLGPLIAGAGIAGLAIGFGAQSLVKDFLSGFFMLVEDQYGVGDVVDLGEATGAVEQVTLRTTRLRDVEGTVWHVPNGQIMRVGNKSQDWARALVDVTVAVDTDVPSAIDVIRRVAGDLRDDPTLGEALLEDPEVWGVERLAADGITIRMVVKTKPGAQWKVARELRARLKPAFEEAGVGHPVPQQVIRVQSPQSPPATPPG